VPDIFLRAPLTPTSDIQVQDPRHERMLVEVITNGVVRASFMVYPSGNTVTETLSLSTLEWGAIDFTSHPVQVRLTKSYGPISVTQMRIVGTENNLAGNAVIDTLHRTSRPRPFAPGIAR
jgi:hypothetical protein